MRGLALVLLAVIGAGGPAVATPQVERASSLSSDAAARVDALARRLAEQDRFSGVLAIARDGETLFVHAYGLAGREKHVPVRPDTAFALASAGKMFTVVAILQFVAAGRLSLDDTVGKVLPDYPNHEIATKVTVRMLLTHRGGTGDIPIFGKEDAGNRQNLRTVADYVNALGTRPPEFEPGSKESYSNYGFVILGRMIEKLSGQSYYDYIRDHVFQPAGMEHSSYPIRDEAAPGVATGYTATDWDFQPTALRANTDTLPWRGSPAGGGVASAPDLLRFVAALQSGRLLPVPLFTQAITAQFPGLGFGLWLGGEGRASFWGHGGGAWGMNAEVRVFPNAGYTIVCLANRDPQVADRIADYFEASLAGPQRVPPLFLRGTMNDWSTSTPMEKTTGGTYRAEVALKTGSYEFKIASADWKTVDLGDGGFGPAAIRDQTQAAPLSMHGANLHLTLSADGKYVFELQGLGDGDPQVSVRPPAR
ncbi:MAG TPA: serine hydrolase [Rhizomicrobium sp.]|nr:serine hydrolase [Rhizomicrobium sp.]